MHEKPCLYIGHHGHSVTRHSYSGSSDFQFCPRRYELKRVIGWREKGVRAAQAFGECIERAVRYYHEQDKKDTVEFFTTDWKQTSKDPKYAGMTYSDNEVDFETLMQTGIEMMQLYALRIKDFPYEETGILFQADRRLEIVDGIEFVAYLDMVVHLKNGERGILDCKVSGAKIPDFVVLDPQLQSYSWVEKCPNVGFLWFQKIGRGIKKGSEVTLLDSGNVGVVIKVETDDFGTRYWVGSAKVEEEMDKLFPSNKKSKEVLDAKQKWISEHAALVQEKLLTKQLVQVRMAKVPLKMAQERGRGIAQDVADIRSASAANFFPQEGGIRFPNDKCLHCEMRGICSGDDEVRDKLVQISTDELDLIGRDNDPNA